MTNEILFLVQIVFLSLTALLAHRLGSQALCSFICLQALMANLFVTKQILLFGFNATCADSYSVAASLALILAQERYGYAQSRHYIWISFCILAIFSIICQMHLAFMPSTQDTSNQHFVEIFGLIPRILASSMFAFVCSQLLDAWIYKTLTLYANQLPITIRTLVSVAITQFVDTVLFTLCALYGLNDHLSHIIIFSYGIKLTICFFMTPLTRHLINQFSSQPVENNHIASSS